MTNILDREYIYCLITGEREFQESKWGPRESIASDSRLALTILMEEVGEIARALLEHDDENLKDELVQVASVCVAWLEGIFGNYGN